ncbi:MAG: MinD/ParA family protein [Phycisphaerae bacterium]|nr:MinD/ParA family protein [Phycisphaerae bacterium]
MTRDDQAGKLRQLMRDVRTTRTIAVTGGKGGVGKSNVALNLAILLSAGGNRVALVDADLGLANLDVLLDVAAPYDLSHVVRGRKRLAEVIVDLPCGVQLVPGASGLEHLTRLGEFEQARLIEELTALEADNDFIVVDCAAGIAPATIRFATSADNTILVSTPEPTAITDAYAVVKVLTRHGYDGRMSLLTNMVADRHEARASYERLSGVARQFLAMRVLDAGYVLRDVKLPDAVRRREPVVLAYPRCPATRCLAALANKLGRGGLLVKEEMGFFRRLARWFA